MSAIQDAVLAAVGDGARTSGAIADATGLEPNQVHGAVFHLKKTGAIAKGEEGFELGAGAAPRARVHTIAALGEDDAPPPAQQDEENEAYEENGRFGCETREGDSAEGQRPRAGRVRGVRRFRRRQTQGRHCVARAGRHVAASDVR